MRHRAFAFLAVAVMIGTSLAWGQKDAIQVQSQDQMAKFLPATVFLDGENVPTQKRNAVLVDLGGKKTIISLVDTSGYSSAYQQKYSGVILTQGPVKIGSATLAPGAYGFGETKAGDQDKAAVTLHIYDLGGKEVAQVPTEREPDMKGVRPVQVKTGSDGTASLYLGPYHASLAAGE
ncbi:MAG: hypothetical protein ACXVZV_07780 [Terriglobales bacterium]